MKIVLSFKIASDNIHRIIACLNTTGCKLKLVHSNTNLISYWIMIFTKSFGEFIPRTMRNWMANVLNAWSKSEKIVNGRKTFAIFNSNLCNRHCGCTYCCRLYFIIGVNHLRVRFHVAFSGYSSKRVRLRLLTLERFKKLWVCEKCTMKSYVSMVLK